MFQTTHGSFMASVSSEFIGSHCEPGAEKWHSIKYRVQLCGQEKSLG